MQAPWRVVGMHLDERLWQMGGEPRALSGARHGVPLVAHASGIEAEREVAAGRGGERRRLRRHEARLAVGREEAAAGKKRASGRAVRPRTGHCVGASASYSWLEIIDRPPMSKSRVPPFSKLESAACSRKMSAGDR